MCYCLERVKEWFEILCDKQLNQFCCIVLFILNHVSLVTLVSKQAFVFQLFTIVRNTKQAQESVEFGESQQVSYQLIISCCFVISFIYFSSKTL